MKNELTGAGLLAMAMILASGSTAMASNKWFVNGIKGSDSNDCISWRHACQTIGHAISPCWLPQPRIPKISRLTSA